MNDNNSKSSVVEVNDNNSKSSVVELNDNRTTNVTRNLNIEYDNCITTDKSQKQTQDFVCKNCSEKFKSEAFYNKHMEMCNYITRRKSIAIAKEESNKNNKDNTHESSEVAEKDILQDGDVLYSFKIQEDIKPLEQNQDKRYQSQQKQAIEDDQIENDKIFFVDCAQDQTNRTETPKRNNLIDP